MNIEIRPVVSPRDVKRFIHFPFTLYQHDPYWVPPLLLDEYTYYNPKTNFNLRNNPYQLFLAYKDQRLVGRVMALIHEQANAFRHEQYVRWTYLDAIEDQEVVHALLHAAEDWGKARGMEFAVGPRGFSDQEPEGALVEGFDERALISTHYNRPSLLTYLEQAGYQKDVDWVCYRMNVPEELPPIYRAIEKRLLRHNRFTCRNFTRKADLQQYILPVLVLWNETYKDLYGVAPVQEEEFTALAKKFMPILNPRFVHIITEEDKLIGFSVVMPDVTEGLQKARGRLFPFGWWHLLRALKTSKTLQFMLVGVKEEYRRQGLFALFGIALLKEVQAVGMTRVYSHLQLEENNDMNIWLERLDGKIFRRYRAFIKKL